MTRYRLAKKIAVPQENLRFQKRSTSRSMVMKCSKTMKPKEGAMRVLYGDACDRIQDSLDATRNA